MDLKSNPDQLADMLLFTQFAVDNLSDAAYWVQEDASIIYVNQAACQMLGYTREELLSKRIYELNPDIPHQGWPEVWRRLREAKRRIFEGRHIAKDGRIIPIEICANLLEFKGQEFSCAFTRDITERKRLEQRLRQAEKMDAIGHLAGGIAHDFNNQLAGILGYADLLEAEIRVNPRLLALVGHIQQLVGRASDLTSQLLAFARKGNYRAEPLNVEELVTEVVGILSHTIDKKIAIEQKLLAKQPVVLGDPSQLQSAILNLALNARDAMPQGGQLTMSTGNISLDQELCSRQPFQVSPGNYVCVSVEDTGSGMSPEVLARIFEPFYTTKDTGQGTGLGLAAVYGTIKNHQGAIDIRSEHGKGTTARLYLHVADAIPAATLVEPSHTAFSRNAHVLVVDDEPLLRDVARQLLLLLGCTVEAFENGQQAVAYYEQSRERVDLVLLDMRMPVMDGRETYLALRRINPNVKALLASGYSVEGEAQSLLAEGVQGFIQKPYSKQMLANEIQRILDT